MADLGMDEIRDDVSTRLALLAAGSLQLASVFRLLADLDERGGIDDDHLDAVRALMLRGELVAFSMLRCFDTVDRDMADIHYAITGRRGTADINRRAAELRRALLEPTSTREAAHG